MNDEICCVGRRARPRGRHSRPVVALRKSYRGTGALRSLALVALVAGVAFAGCASDDAAGTPSGPALLLSSEQTVDTIRLAVVAIDEDGTRLVSGADDSEGLVGRGLGGLDLTATPFRVSLKFPASYPAEVTIHILGYLDGRIRSRWTGVVDTSMTGTRSVTLLPLRPECDLDGDGFPDCKVDGCCSAPSDVGGADCDDKRAYVSPGRGPLATCIPCTAMDLDYFCSGEKRNCDVADEAGCAVCDSSEPAVEICNGADDDCDGLVDEDFIGASAAETCPTASAPPCYEWGPTCSASGAEVQCGLRPRADGDSCTVTAADPCLAGDGVCVAKGGALFCELVESSCPEPLPCQELECDGEDCEPVVRSGWCVVEGTCVADKQTAADNSCLRCDSEVDATGWTPSPTDTYCTDGNPCTIDDRCDGAGLCSARFEVNCDDENPCTVDSCTDLGECDNLPDSGTDCDDGDACTAPGVCAEGVCIGQEALNCDDANPCTTDSCSPANGCSHMPMSDEECSDSDACTAADVCVAGVCVGQSLVCDDKVDCTVDFCQPASGCVFWPVDGMCDDDDPCTTPICNLGAGCVASAGLDGLICDDGTACTVEDRCFGGLCQPGAARACDDGDACTVDTCDPGIGCVHVTAEDGMQCDDGDACTQDGQCAAGECVGAPVDCADEFGCTVDTCASDSGCVHTPVDELCAGAGPCQVATCSEQVGCQSAATNEGGGCDDGNACTVTDLCDADGQCVGSGGPDCDDGNVCTTDTCTAEVGCVHAPNSAGCDDGDACSTADVCAGGVCGGTALVCNDDNPCTTNGCQPASGCVFAPENGAGCDDNDACTVADECQDGKCGGVAAICDDGNACTADACDPLVGCQFQNDDELPCDDEDACTQGDTCSAGLCATSPVPCSDADPCTTDTCDPTVGCQFLPATGVVCDDGNPCTLGDVCGDGVCSGVAIDCDDGNACTNDTCNGLTGKCEFMANSGACDDGDACTTGDKCSKKACVGVQMPCDDGNQCTQNLCVAGACQHPVAANGLECEDGDPCTGPGSCTDGICVAPPLDCEDGNLCTTDKCVGGQCTHSPLEDGAPCNDGVDCTSVDKCAAGVCVGTPDHGMCADDDCLIEFCDLSVGCVNTNIPDHAACADPNPCTVDTCLPDGTCDSKPEDTKCPADHTCQAGGCMK